MDEAWRSFVYAKEAHLGQAKSAPKQAGDVWLWIAFDPETKLIPSWRIGDRTLETAIEFMADLKGCLTHLKTTGSSPIVFITDCPTTSYEDKILEMKNPKFQSVSFWFPYEKRSQNIPIWGKPVVFKLLTASS